MLGSSSLVDGVENKDQTSATSKNDPSTGRQSTGTPATMQVRRRKSNTGYEERLRNDGIVAERTTNARAVTTREDERLAVTVSTPSPQAVDGRRRGRPSHIEIDLDMPSPAHTNITMDTAVAMMNDETLESVDLG